MTEKNKGFHILAHETEEGYMIVIPEYPNVDVTCTYPEDIVPHALMAKAEDERNRIKKTAVCPDCGKRYTGYPAVSRKDNRTEVCPDCGILQALEVAGIDEVEKSKILSEIHKAGTYDSENL
jgi:hypothetical protein